jgi:2-keto-4-pentenoate hydratase
LLMIYIATYQASGVSPIYFLLHPVAALLFLYAILRSMALTLARGGVIWRGTFYPLEELRRGMV